MHAINDTDLDEMVLVTKAHRDGQDFPVVPFSYKGVEFEGEVFCKDITERKDGDAPLGWPLLGPGVGAYMDVFRPLTEEERDALRGKVVSVS